MKYQFLIIMSLIALLSACSQSPQYTPMGEARAQQSIEGLNRAPARHVAYQPTVTVSDLIAAQDVLDVNVFKVDDLSAKKLTVEANGTISLPLIGAVKVQGLTINQAEKTITAKLKKYMQDPKVSITRTDKAISKRVTVEGEVRMPGVYPIKGNLSFLQAIAMSQGLTEVADTRNVLLYRDGGQHNVSLELIRLGRLQDPVLRNDDRIVVLKDPKKVREKKLLEYIPAVTAPFSIFRF